VILGGDVAVCLLLSAHRVVIFVIAQLSCFALGLTMRDLISFELCSPSLLFCKPCKERSCHSSHLMSSDLISSELSER